ncbi:MAG: hypothetical protein WKG07_38995 [Hymenobacter sp.]
MPPPSTSTSRPCTGTSTRPSASWALKKRCCGLGYPLLQRLGVGWKAGSLSVAQERLVTQLLRQELLASSDALPLIPLSQADAPRWLLFLPEGEWHELALLFMNYALRARGRQVLYLGPNLPLADVAAAAAAFRPTVLATVLTTAPARGQVQQLGRRAARPLPRGRRNPVRVAGRAGRRAARRPPAAGLPARVSRFNSLCESASWE